MRRVLIEDVNLKTAGDYATLETRNLVFSSFIIVQSLENL